MVFQPGRRISVSDFIDPKQNIQEDLIRRALGQPELGPEQAPVDMNRMAELERKAQLYDAQVNQPRTMQGTSTVDDFLIKYPTQEPQRTTPVQQQTVSQPQVAPVPVGSPAPVGAEPAKSGDMFDGLLNIFGDKPKPIEPSIPVASDRIEGYAPQQEPASQQAQPQGSIPQELKSTIDGINDFNTRIFNISREKGYDPKDVSKFMADAFGTPEGVMDLYEEYVSVSSTAPQQQPYVQPQAQPEQLRNPALESLQRGPSLINTAPASGVINVDSQYDLAYGDRLRV